MKSSEAFEPNHGFINSLRIPIKCKRVLLRKDYLEII
jgi:hypothetical protein